MRRSTVLLAEIDRPRGLGGEVVATLHADDPRRLDSVEKVWIVPRSAPAGREAAEGRAARLQGWKRSGDRVVLKLEGIDSIEAARAVAGAEVRVDAADSPEEAPEGRWFAHQLEGLEVVTTSGEVVGRVARILCPAGQALLEVEGPRGGCLVPLVASICVKVDPAAGRIEIEPPEGLLELNAV